MFFLRFFWVVDRGYLRKGSHHIDSVETIISIVMLIGMGWFSDTSTKSFEGRNDLKKTIMNKLERRKGG